MRLAGNQGRKTPVLIYKPMRRIYFLLISLFLVQEISGQTQSILFEKTWGIGGNSVITYAEELPNGDYILIGLCPGFILAQGPGPYQLYMCRTDSLGNLLWEKTYGDPYEIDLLGCVIKTKESSYLLVGKSFYSSYDVHVINLDVNGDILFDGYYHSGYFDSGSSAIQTSDSGFVIAVKLDAGGSVAPGLIKIDKNGNEIWRHRDDSLLNYVPLFIQTTSDSGFIVAGRTPYYENAYLTKYSSAGTLEWIRYPYGRILDTLANGCVGLFMKTDTTFEVAMAVENPENYIGETHWKQYDYSGNELADQVTDFPLFVLSGANLGPTVVDNLNGMFISCSAPYWQGSTWIMEVDSNKNYYFRAKITDEDSTNKDMSYTIRTRDGGYLSVGSRNYGFNTWSQFYLVKFAPDGRYVAEDFSESVSAYPNPSSDGNFTLTFDMIVEDNVQVDIFTLEGKVIYSKTIFCPATSHTELSVRLENNSIAGGVYILQARTSSAVIRKQLVVMRQQ
jgi:hypothetical protein